MGCSDLPNPGVVTVDGQPLGNAIDNFSPGQPGRPSTAETDAEGIDEIMYLSEISIAVVGDHTVTVENIVTLNWMIFLTSEVRCPRNREH